MVTGRPNALRKEERWLLLAGCAIAMPVAWLRAGTHAPWTAPLLWVALGMAMVLFAVAAWRVRRAAGPEEASRPPLLRLRDPVAWLGLAFLLVLAVQWWNAGRVLYFDAASQTWSYSAPRIAWMPSAITPGEARQMLDWFVPAWVLLLVVRSPALGGRGVRMFWRLLVFHAALLALFGVIQYATGTTRMYGLVPMRPHFFASFGYPNHAGAYFVMTLCLAAGLLCHDAALDASPRRRFRVAGLVAAFLLSLVGANLSLSRFAIVASWLLAVVLAVYMVRFFWPRWTPSARVNAIASAAAVLCLAAVLTGGLGREAIRREFNPPPQQQALVQRETSFRWFQVKSAYHMWRDYPWFGVGGWGYRYLLAHYLPQQEWRRITEGKANVHNDPVQFLVEFGAVGAGALAAIVALLVRAAHRSPARRQPLVLFPLMGAGLVALQSLIDLPFRSPAVLYAWLLCLAGASRVLPPRRAPDAPGATQLNVPAPVDMIRTRG